MKHAIVIAALAALMTACGANAQRSQALCQGDADGVVDGQNCVEMGFRMWSGLNTQGLEEDTIIGVGSADVTLDHDDLAALPTTRVVLVPAPGAGKYLWIDWAAVIKPGSDDVPYTETFSTLGLTVASAAGGVLSGTAVPTVYAQAAGYGIGIWDDAAPFIRRYSPGSPFGGGESSIEDMPIVALVSSAAADWAAVVAEIATTETLRIVVRYRVIDTADTF